MKALEALTFRIETTENEISDAEKQHKRYVEIE